MLASSVRARDRERTLCIRHYGFDPRKQRHPAAPRTRADCINGPRPCPFIACKMHLWLDIGRRGHRSHVVKWHFRGVYVCPSQMPKRSSCALDLADDHAQGGMTLGEIGAAWNLHPERVRQIEVAAIAKVRRAFRKLGIDASWLDALAIEIPESTFAQAMDRAAQVAGELDLSVDLPDEPPASAAKVIAVPRNGTCKTSLPQHMPTPTPVTPSTHKPRTSTILL